MYRNTLRFVNSRSSIIPNAGRAGADDDAPGSRHRRMNEALS